MAEPIFFRKLTHSSVWLPNYVASSVPAISIQALQQTGIRHMIVDIDRTLVPFRGDQLDPAYIQYFKDVRRAGIGLTIGSNTRRDITGIANSIDAQIVARPWWSYKPMGAFYNQILARTEHAPTSIVMVGDHVINDVIGANRVGLTTILVAPLGQGQSWLLRQYGKYLSRRG